MDLKDMIEKGIDAYHFSGKRNIEPTIVTCKNEEFSDDVFNERSMLGKTRQEYLENLKKFGLTPGKEYICKKIEAFGDVFDMEIESNDFNNKESYASFFFKVK